MRGDGIQHLEKVEKTDKKQLKTLSRAVWHCTYHWKKDHREFYIIQVQTGPYSQYNLE